MTGMRYTTDWLRVQLRKHPGDHEVAFLLTIVDRNPLVASDAERRRLEKLAANGPQLDSTREIIIAGAAEQLLRRLDES